LLLSFFNFLKAKLVFKKREKVKNPRIAIVVFLEKATPFIQNLVCFSLFSISKKLN
jgi:hypothetical protein